MSHEHRISVLQPSANGLGGKSWKCVWTGANGVKAIFAFMIIIASRQGRQLRMEWGTAVDR